MPDSYSNLCAQPTYSKLLALYFSKRLRMNDTSMVNEILNED